MGLFATSNKKRITKEEVEERMRSISGREKYELLHWENGSNPVIVKINNCGHSIIFTKGNFIYTTKKRVWRWDGKCFERVNNYYLRRRIEENGMEECYKKILNRYNKCTRSVNLKILKSESGMLKLYSIINSSEGIVEEIPASNELYLEIVNAYKDKIYIEEIINKKNIRIK